jgi:hypothetical protein
MQITSITIVLFAAIGAVANPIATESDDLNAWDLQRSKYGGVSSSSEKWKIKLTLLDQFTGMQLETQHVHIPKGWKGPCS